MIGLSSPLWASLVRVTSSAQPATARGRAARQRIVQAAAQLVAEQGAAATTLDDVGARAGASRSQLYHYFADRDDLLRAVVATTADAVLAGQDEHLARLDRIEALEAWAAGVVGLQEARDGRGGCPVGTLVGQLAERDEGARAQLAASFDRWEGSLAQGLERMRAAGRLRADADPDRLAASIMASLQGGLLLAQVRRDPARLRIALDGALALVRAAAP